MKRPSPTAVSRELARIAMSIESAEAPSLSRVHGDLRRVVATVTREAKVRRLAQEILRLAQEDVELSLWDMESAKDVDLGMKAAKGEASDAGKLQTALKSLKVDIDTFIGDLSDAPKEPEGDDEDVFSSAPARRDIGKKPEPPAKKGPPGPPPRRE